MTAAAGRRVARRYELERVIGTGAHGEVWRAHDALADRPVALKIMAPVFAAARVRREVAALRLLRLPGVVGFVDEGVDESDPFLVMDLVEGTAFPGVSMPCRWDRIEEATFGLLDILGRIHAAGVVHRDLKPPNVLVSAERHVTLLDFGLCDGSLDDAGDDEGAVIGSPAYLAPEQIRGEPVSPATDLYTLGLLLHQALSGRPAHPTDDPVALTRARLSSPAPSLLEVAPATPPFVAQVVDALLKIEATERPQSASEVMARLRGGTSSRLDPIEVAVARVEDRLEQLFAGPDRLLHLREDAVRLLRERTGGDSTKIVDELKAWLRGGLARWDGGRLIVDRAALERLEAMPWSTLLRTGSRFRDRAAHRSAAESSPPGSLEKLMHLVAAGRGGRSGIDDLIAQEALLLARTLAQRGRLETAAFVLGEAERAVSDDHAAVSILSQWAEVALFERTPRSIDRVLYAVCRREGGTDPLPRLEALLRAALAIGTWTERALAMVDDIPAFDDPALERCRHDVRVRAARRSSLTAEETVLGHVAHWASSTPDPQARVSFASWLGRLRYRQGRFKEAAALHDEAARAERWATARIAARINAASALMESFQLQEAARQAAEAKELAASYRDAFFEGRAEWLLRAIDYRLGKDDAPDYDLVDAAAKVAVRELEALVCLNEAALAFRIQRVRDAADLSSRALRLWTDIGDPSGTLIASGLCLACGVQLGEVARLVERARESSVPGLGLQVIALVAASGMRMDLAPHEMRRLAERVPRDHWGARMEVLSVDESLGLLGAGGGHP